MKVRITKIKIKEGEKLVYLIMPLKKIEKDAFHYFQNIQIFLIILLKKIIINHIIFHIMIILVKIIYQEI